MKAWILIFATACTADATTGTTVQPAIAANAIAANAVTTNAIAANAIAANAIAANGILTGAVTDPTVALALEDPNARIFMRYLVGCALTPGQSISWTGRTGLRETWTGLLGLCPAWQTGPADTACRQRVSACILARNNAFGVSVAFSMRGTADGGTPLALGDRVPPHDHIPRTNRDVPSLAGCTRAFNGELRDCGWQADSVGVCTPGTTVSIAAGNYSDGCNGDWLGVEGSTDEVLRVCPGTSACDRRFAIASVDNSCWSYAPAVEFTCPDDGHYAVMKGTFDAHGRADGEVASSRTEANLCQTLVGDAKPACRTSWDWTCDSEAERLCHYPATEAQVFRWREGAFYGDLFGTTALNPAKPQVQVDPKTLRVQSLTKDGWIDGNEYSNAFVGVVFRSMYACASSNWTWDAAYMARRVCAGSDPQDPSKYTRNCAAAYVGRCKDVCATQDAPPVLGDYDAASCLSKDRKWAVPMTTFLAMPSDAIPDPSVNGTVSPNPIFNW